MKKKIEGFSNYTISESGEVTRTESKHPRWGTLTVVDKVMKPGYTGKKRNYMSIRLTNLEGVSQIFKVHRLVAKAFLPNPEGKPQVNHIDGNPSNNNVSNLEWCTNSENQIHAYETGLHKGMNGVVNPAYGKPGVYKNKRGDDHNKSIRVVQMTLDGEVINGFESGILAAEAVGGNSSNIMKVCKGVLRKSSGFKWCFPTEDHKYLFTESMYAQD
jgi:hypothetical protein